MQDTNAATHPDSAGTTCWAAAKPAGAHPTRVDIPSERIAAPPLLPPPAFGGALLLAIAGCFLTPFAWVCWGFSNGQLRAIERGERSTVGKDTIVLARGMAKVVTFFTLAVFVIALAVGFSRVP